jgi:hypothetical protein
VALLPRRYMWRGKGCLPRHAARRGQMGHQVQNNICQGLFLKIIKKRIKLKNGRAHPRKSIILKAYLTCPFKKKSCHFEKAPTGAILMLTRMASFRPAGQCILRRRI